MNTTNAEKIFRRYNQEKDVVRCPYGRASVRTLLDRYAKAATNLYGVIRKDEFVKLFNQQNTLKTTSDELYVLLLPIVLKSGWYGFYKEYLVHYSIFEDFDYVDYLLKHQEGKPRYVPEREEFLKYETEGYEDNDHWWNVRKFMWDVFGYSGNTSRGFEETKDYITYGLGISELGSILDRNHLMFGKEEQLHEFVRLLMLAKNNNRIWLNNGWTPNELQKQFVDKDKESPKIRAAQVKKIGRNDPCPCGSGKKYKKCCARLEDAKTAQLSTEDGYEFYEIWLGLISFVNERKHVVQEKIKPNFPNTTAEENIYKVREVLWETPEIIDDYIKESRLSNERIEILKAWRNNQKKGSFFIMEYRPDYAVAIATDENGEDRLYGIKGITHSIASAFDYKLPFQIETVLLPFRGALIYDSFIVTMPIGFGDGAKAVFKEMYEKALQKGIIASF